MTSAGGLRSPSQAFDQGHDYKLEFPDSTNFVFFLSRGYWYTNEKVSMPIGPFFA